MTLRGAEHNGNIERVVGNAGSSAGEGRWWLDRLRPRRRR